MVFLRERTSLVKKLCPHGLLTNRLCSLKVKASSAFWPSLAAETHFEESSNDFFGAMMSGKAQETNSKY